MALLGQDAGGLSASTIGRLKRRLVGGAHALEQARPVGQTLRLFLGRWDLRAGSSRRTDAQCLLVIIGATPEGKKELVVSLTAYARAIVELDLKRRGLVIGTHLEVAANR